jgi:hypothetical protein
LPAVWELIAFFVAPTSLVGFLSWRSPRRSITRALLGIQAGFMLLLEGVLLAIQSVPSIEAFLE